MPDSYPLNGNDAYEMLGVSPDDSLETIRGTKEELLEEYRSRMRTAPQEDDTEKFKRSAEAIEAIENAWGWVEQNHSPNDSTGASTEASEATAVLDLPADAAPRTIETRRDQLLDEYRNRMVKARQDDDNEAFKAAADRITEIEQAAERLLVEGSETAAEQERTSNRASNPGSEGAVIPAEDPHELFGLSGDASEAEFAARRDELIAKYTARLTPETYADEPWRFRLALRAVAAVDDAWRAITTDETVIGE
jgi:DnaJ-domain-containing protein 1